MTSIARYRKFIVALLGAAAEAAVAIPPDSPAWRWAQVLIAVATAAGVYGVRNKQAVPPGG